MEEQRLEPLGDWKKYDPRYRAVADYFGVEPNREWSRYSDKINYLFEWAKKTAKSEDLNKIAQALKKVESNTRNPAWNERRIDTVYQSIRLDEDRVKTALKPKPAEPKLTDEQKAQIFAKSISQAVRKELKVALKEIKPEAPKAPEPVEETNYVDYTPGW